MLEAALPESLAAGSAEKDGLMTGACVEILRRSSSDRLRMTPLLAVRGPVRHECVWGARPEARRYTIPRLFVGGGGYLQDGQEGFLGDVYFANAFHAAFAFFLFL